MTENLSAVWKFYSRWWQTFRRRRINWAYLAKICLKFVSSMFPASKAVMSNPWPAECMRPSLVKLISSFLISTIVVPLLLSLSMISHLRSG